MRLNEENKTLLLQLQGMEAMIDLTTNQSKEFMDWMRDYKNSDERVQVLSDMAEIKKLKEELEVLREQVFELEKEKANFIANTMIGEEKPIVHTTEIPKSPSIVDLPPLRRRSSSLMEKFKTSKNNGERIDLLLNKFLTDMNITPTSFKKMADGIYMVGNKRLNIRSVNGTDLSVLVGGTFVPFSDWIYGFARQEGLLTKTP